MRKNHGTFMRRCCAIGAIMVGVAMLPPGNRNCRGDSQNGAKNSATKNLAEKIFQETGIQRGVCAVLNADLDLALSLAQDSELLVHVRAADDAAVADLRAKADRAGFGIDRLAVEKCPSGSDRLPYADNLLDIVVTHSINPISPKRPSAEVMRVLRPGGTAILIDSATTENDSQGSSRAFTVDVKPMPEGVDEWSHWEHGPDNNPVSTDRVIQAPYMSQFLAGPLYIGMPAITTAAGGRTFLAAGHIAHHRREWDALNKLIARNGYNGTILWQRDLPENYMVHRSAFVATADTFYMLDGDRCLLLDSRSGKEQGEIRVPGIEGEWKWMAMVDNVLYVLAGKPGPGIKIIKGDRTYGGWSWDDLSVGYYQKPRVPWGFGHTLAAYHLGDRRVLWTHQEPEPVIDSRSLAIGDGRIFFYCPEQNFRCLDAATGSDVWTNDDDETLDLIETPGQGLTSTPGFRSVCLAVYTPKALIVQGQTRMNVVALSTDDGSRLWTKRKVTNNPNAIYIDGRVILGIGPTGNHVAVDPVSGEVLEDLPFRKVSCVRLTATPDSLFCRGEGTLRFDRQSKQVLVDGSVRPACNDGALPAGGMLHLGPWSCDCNLSLLGAYGKCSAGDFRFDHEATDAERLEPVPGDIQQIAPLETTPNDWPTYRANNHRAASSNARLARPGPDSKRPMTPRWEYVPDRSHVPTTPVSAGGLVFVGGQDGKIRAIDAKSGALRWSFATSAPIMAAPTVADGRLYFGGGDGYAYALEAATGRMLWRFRGAPVERHIMVYGALGSTWPVHGGVLVEDGTAYFAAGIIDQDGTYVYAVDAKTGKLRWQNHSSGHLNPELRKGVSVQGNLTVQGDQLLLAGGNQISPARFDLATGKCLARARDRGQPQANGGRFVGVFDEKHAISGGQTLYGDPRNVATKGSFVVSAAPRTLALNYGGIPPAWNESTVALANFRYGKITCCDTSQLAAQMDQGFPPPAGGRPQRWRTLADVLLGAGQVRWQSDLNEPNKFQVLALAVCPESVVAVVQFQHRIRAHPQWFVVALRAEDATPYWFWRHELHSEPLCEGLLIDRDGCVVVTQLNGNVLRLGPPDA